MPLCIVAVAVVSLAFLLASLEQVLYLMYLYLQLLIYSSSVFSGTWHIVVINDE